MTPLVTVIIPAYNAGDYLRPALKSIQEQTYTNLEIVLIDDGSTDGSVDALNTLGEDSRVRIIRQANAGKPAAMNRVVREAAGTWIVIQDADDVAHPERIMRLLETAQSEPDLGAVFSGYHLLLNDRPVAPLSERKNRTACREDIEQFRMPSHDPTIMFRASIGRELGFDEELRGTEGYDFILRLGERHPLMVIPEVLYGYRIHSDSITRRDPLARHQLMIRTLTKACQRRGLTVEQRFPDLCLSNTSTILDDNGLDAHFTQCALNAREVGNHLAAWKAALESVAFQPLSSRYYRPLVCAALPLPILQRLRRSRRRQELSE